MDPLEEGAVHSAMPHQRKFNWQQTDLNQTTDARYTCDWEMLFQKLESCESRKNPSQRFGQEGKSRSLSGVNEAQAGHSRDAESMATAFDALNRSLKTFLARLSRSNERSEKSRRVFNKPRCYKDESDGCIDTWIEVMKLHFEEEDLSERQECSALTSNLEGTALNCVMAKKQYQRDTTEKIFEILVKSFWLRGTRTPSNDALREMEAT